MLVIVDRSSFVIIIRALEPSLVVAALPPVQLVHSVHVFFAVGIDRVRYLGELPSRSSRRPSIRFLSALQLGFVLDLV